MLTPVAAFASVPPLEPLSSLALTRPHFYLLRVLPCASFEVVISVAPQRDLLNTISI